jgi:hypothetical protein
MRVKLCDCRKPKSKKKEHLRLRQQQTISKKKKRRAGGVGADSFLFCFVCMIASSRHDAEGAWGRFETEEKEDQGGSWGGGERDERGAAWLKRERRLHGLPRESIQ